MKDQTLLKYVRRYVNEYDLIQEGDRIAVGVSGGKDSMALLYALSRLRYFSPVRFSLAAVAVDPGFSMDYSEIRAFSESLGVPFILEKTEISRIVFEERKRKPPLRTLRESAPRRSRQCRCAGRLKQTGPWASSRGSPVHADDESDL